MTLRNGTVFTLQTDIAEIDLLAEVAGLGSYQEARTAAVVIKAFDRDVATLDLPALIRCKRAAGRPRIWLLWLISRAYSKPARVNLRRARLRRLEHLIAHRSLPHLRPGLQILVLLILCLAGCAFLNLALPPRPSLIAGIVVNWFTKQPVPNIDVRVRQLNSTPIVARTDANGHFSYTPVDEPNVPFLFADGSGKLLQATFGRMVVLDRRGKQVPNVLIPSLPATEVTGHVSASDGHPMAGCTVTAITPDTANSDKALNFYFGAKVESIQSASQREEDHSLHKFLYAESEQTDGQGFYNLSRLGADRYFFLAHCPAEGRNHPETLSWETTAYPQAASILAAQEIVLLPGDHRTGIDFRMQLEAAFSFEGKIVLSDTSVPMPDNSYFDGLDSLREDGLPTSLWLGQEACRWGVHPGTFACQGLAPGTYTLYFDLHNFPSESRQFARITYTVLPSQKQMPLSVQLTTDRPSQRTFGSTGTLDFGNACLVEGSELSTNEVSVTGLRRAERSCLFMAIEHLMRFPLPEDTYAVTAFESSFFARGQAGRPSKIKELIMRHGTPVHVRQGQTTNPSLRVITTDELITTALNSLKH